MQIFFLGALAKLGATVVTYPLLVVKVNSIVSETKGCEEIGFLYFPKKV